MIHVHSQQLARDDIVHGLSDWRIWWTLGCQDIQQRYRRTMLGPFWVTASMLVMIGSMGLVFSKVLQADIDSYLPYLAAGLVTWGLISQICTEAPAAFITAQHIITSLNLPLTVHVMRVLVRQALIFVHNLAAFALVALWFGTDAGASALLVAPGVALVLANSVWMGLILATLGARYRDLQPIVATVLQFFFFITPIVWRPADVGSHVYLVLANPVYHLVEVVRSPMLGQPAPLLSYAACVGLFFAGSAAAYMFFLRFRRRVTYWL